MLGREEEVVPISFTINGMSMTRRIEPSLTLLALIREELSLKGTKPGCLEGECGACTVLIDGSSVNSCLYLAVNINGRSVQTIEGLGSNGPNAGLDRVQEALIRNGAIQCGFCTPGMVMAIKSFETACRGNGVIPDREEIKKSLAGNLCRCTGYVKIIEAVESLFREP